jgi:hypothetical protein
MSCPYGIRLEKMRMHVRAPSKHGRAPQLPSSVGQRARFATRSAEAATLLQGILGYPLHLFLDLLDSLGL